MIYDQQVGILSSLAGAVEGANTAGALETIFGRAKLIFCRQSHPGLPFGGTVEVDLIAIPAAGFLQPNQDFREHAQLIGGIGTALAQALHSPRAQIVGTTL